MCVCVCLCVCECVCVCVQMVGLHRDFLKNPEVAHNNITEEHFDRKSMCMKNPFNLLKIRSLLLVRLHCIFVISE